MSSDATTVPDELVRAATAGDRDAVERLLAVVRPHVVRYCRARLGPPNRSPSADDVAQEVCLAVLTGLPGYRFEGKPFLAFVLRRRRAQGDRRAPGGHPHPLGARRRDSRRRGHDRGARAARAARRAVRRAAPPARRAARRAARDPRVAGGARAVGRGDRGDGRFHAGSGARRPAPGPLLDSAGRSPRPGPGRWRTVAGRSVRANRGRVQPRLPARTGTRTARRCSECISPEHRRRRPLSGSRTARRRWGRPEPAGRHRRPWPDRRCSVGRPCQRRSGRPCPRCRGRTC